MAKDGAREPTLGNFRKKCRETSCHIKQMQPHSPWMKAAENGVRELKKALTWQILKKHSPKILWDDCLEFQAYVEFNMAGNYFGLKGETPETMLSGVTANVSEFAEHGWYDWIKFSDATLPCPEDKLVLGQCLGPSTEIGPAMMAKTLKLNGKGAHLTTFQGLTTEDELRDPDEAKARKLFDEEIEKHLGPSAKPEDFSDDIELANSALHEDEEQQESVTSDRDNLPDDAYDNHTGAELTLQKGDQVMTACVKRRKLNNLCNAIGTANPNPILDTRLYMCLSSKTVRKLDILQM
jgi:hypothetical protein